MIFLDPTVLNDYGDNALHLAFGNVECSKELLQMLLQERLENMQSIIAERLIIRTIETFPKRLITVTDHQITEMSKLTKKLNFKG